MNFIEGEFIYLNKPYRMSSFGALARVLNASMTFGAKQK